MEEPGQFASRRDWSHRLLPGSVRLLDARGQPRPNVAVTLRQLRHRFLIGSNLFQLNPADDSQAQRAYQEHAARLLNFATLPFYWGAYEREPGRTEEARVRAMAAWCREHGIATKGHPLCWHQIPPAWRGERPLEEMRRLQMERIEREVAAFRGAIDIWDVLNEAVVMPRFTRQPNHMTALVREYGTLPILREAFARARAASPDAMLLLNDFDHSEAYARLIGECLEAGVEIDAIGIQSHMHQGYLGDEHIWSVCERFARFGKPLHWTEATLISGDVRPDNDWHTPQKDWGSTPEGEARQAADVESFYSTLYAHPAVQAITWWDLPDGCWLGAPSGLLRRDRTPKPAYARLEDLVRRRWWFEERALRTDADGVAAFCGPAGTYEAEAGAERVRFEHERARQHVVRPAAAQGSLPAERRSAH